MGLWAEFVWEKKRGKGEIMGDNVKMIIGRVQGHAKAVSGPGGRNGRDRQQN